MAETTGPVFQQTLYIAASSARVWQAITRAEDVVQYHMCPLETMELRPGGRLAHATGGQTFVTGSVIEVVPERKLVHTFRFEIPTHSNVAADPDSRLTYDIEPMGEMCRLTLTHDGFAEENQTYANITGGWPGILSGLKTLVETGKPLPWPSS